MQIAVAQHMNGLRVFQVANLKQSSICNVTTVAQNKAFLTMPVKNTPRIANLISQLWISTPSLLALTYNR